MMQNNKTRNAVILSAGLFLLLGLLFVPECDDCYFSYWKFDSLKNLFLTRPVTTDVTIIGVPANGRYLGNFLGVLQGKLYFTPFGFLRGLLMGAALLAVVYWLSRRFRCAYVDIYEAWLVPCTLILLAPRGIWQQVYTWGAGLVNYLIPIIGILWLLDRLSTWESFDSKRQAAIGIVIFVCCLFMETVTILLGAASTVLFIFSLTHQRKAYSVALPAAIGSWLGIIIMFSAPGYAQTGSDSRAIGLNLAWDNLYVIMSETFVRPAVVTFLISALLIFFLYRQGCPHWKPLGILLALVHIACAADTLIDLFQIKDRYTNIRLVLGCAVLLLWIAALKEWKPCPARRQMLMLLGAAGVTNIPLLFVSPIGPRNFFTGYILFILVIAVLYREARKQGLHPCTWLRAPAVMAGVLLVMIYASNFRVYQQRLDIAKQQVAAGETELHLLFLPFSGWVTNEVPGKGDLTYIVYRDKPWDVTFHFYPWHG